MSEQTVSLGDIVEIIEPRTGRSRSGSIVPGLSVPTGLARTASLDFNSSDNTEVRVAKVKCRSFLIAIEAIIGFVVIGALGLYILFQK